MENDYAIPPYPLCPWCGKPLGQEDPYRQPCTGCSFILYHSSSPCVGALPFTPDRKVLLARRAIKPFIGEWNTVGGFLNYGEDPVSGLIREVKEETGADCTVGDFVTMQCGTYGHSGPALLNIYYAVELHGDTLQPQDDVSELQWFPLHNLPSDIAFPSDRAALSVLKDKLAG